VEEGELGEVYAVDLVFHNAYGPDKSWAATRALGGGCAIDLGIHLVDLALWTLGFPRVQSVTSRLYAAAQPLLPGSAEVEDHAVAQLELANGAWCARLFVEPAGGRDAVIEAHFHGSRGGAAMRNVNGSFYDFIAARFQGTQRAAAGRSARCLGRPRGGRLGARAGGRRALRPEDRDGWCRWPRCWTASMAGEAHGPHVLMTADTVGGVWTYAVELAANWCARHARGARDHGRAAFAHQRTQAAALRGVHAARKQLAPRMDARCPRRRRAMRATGCWAGARLRPDVVHLNQFAFGALPLRAPTLVVAHSCVLSWWRAVHGERAPAAGMPTAHRAPRPRRCHAGGRADARDARCAGLRTTAMCAAAWCCPTDAARRTFGRRASSPCPGGRPLLGRGQEPCRAGSGGAAPAVAACARGAGARAPPDGGGGAGLGRAMPRRAAAPALAAQLAEASIYALPARYEPFGLSVLEAALSGCALVLGDVPSLREVWGDAAVYVPPGRRPRLRAALLQL
jgi:hypothetical protein